MVNVCFLLPKSIYQYFFDYVGRALDKYSVNYKYLSAGVFIAEESETCLESFMIEPDAYFLVEEKIDFKTLVN